MNMRRAALAALAFLAAPPRGAPLAAQDYADDSLPDPRPDRRYLACVILRERHIGHPPAIGRAQGHQGNTSIIAERMTGANNHRYHARIQ
ncbi:MAG: hypothetical protein P8Y48_09545 [Novosphingobium sp.]